MQAIKQIARITLFASTPFPRGAVARGCACSPSSSNRSPCSSRNTRSREPLHDANGMLTVVQEVRSPSVVSRDAAKLRQNPDDFQCGLAPARIDVIVCAAHMHPAPLACHIQPGLILMDDLRLFQRLADLLLHRGQLSYTSLDQITDGAFTHLDPQQVPQHPRRVRARGSNCCWTK